MIIILLFLIFSALIYNAYHLLQIAQNQCELSKILITINRNIRDYI